LFPSSAAAATQAATISNDTRSDGATRPSATTLKLPDTILPFSLKISNRRDLNH
jgi:hypothetical protein